MKPISTTERQQTNDGIYFTYELNFLTNQFLSSRFEKSLN